MCAKLKAETASGRWELALPDYRMARTSLKSAADSLEEWAEILEGQEEEVRMEVDKEEGLTAADFKDLKARVSKAADEADAGVAACMAHVEALRAGVKAVDEVPEPPLEGEATAMWVLIARKHAKALTARVVKMEEKKDSLTARQEATETRERAEVLEEAAEKAHSRAAAVVSRLFSQRINSRSVGEMSAFGAAHAGDSSKEGGKEPPAVSEDKAAVEEAEKETQLVDGEAASPVKDTEVQPGSSVKDAASVPAKNKKARTGLGAADAGAESMPAVESNGPPPKRLKPSMRNSPAPAFDPHAASGGSDSEYGSATQAADNALLPHKQRAHGVTREDDFSETARKLLPDVELHAQLTCVEAAHSPPQSHSPPAGATLTPSHHTLASQPQHQSQQDAREQPGARVEKAETRIVTSANMSSDISTDTSVCAHATSHTRA
eukprot:2859395-Pleurochrysis_carterae.AAC.1